MKIDNKGQAQLFKIKQLEMMTKSNPTVIFVMYIPVILFFLYYSTAILTIGFGNITALFLSGFAGWTIFEYVIHRFVFHLHPKSKTGKKIIYILHGNHHKYPRDRKRLLMPAIPSVMISSLLFLLMYLLAGLFKVQAMTPAFFSGFLSGYLLYGGIHYAIHAWAPPFKWMKPLWSNHHLHHYKDPEKGFGVSSTFWDHVLGSMFDLKKEKEDKQKIKELMFKV